MRKILSSFLMLVVLCVPSWAALSDNLISYWALDEASGTRADKVIASANTLSTSGSAPTQAGGKVYANAGQFTAPSSQYLFHTDNPSLSLTSTAFTIIAWVYLDSTAALQTIYARDDGGTNREVELAWNNSVGFRFRTWTGSGGAGFNERVASTFGTSPSTATWYMIAATSDLTTKKISVNAGTQDSVASANAGWNSTDNSVIGAADTGAGTYFNGRIGPVIFFKRALSASEITQVWNSGNGMTYEAMVAPVPLNTNLISYWPLNEASGNAADAVVASANTLTDNATVTSNQGKVYATARQFTAANSEFMNHADNASLSTGDIDFTLAAFVNLASKGSLRVIISKWVGPTNQREYDLGYDNVSDRFQLLASNDGTATQQLLANNLGSPALNTWYFVVAYHDSVNNLLGISVNNGTFNTVSWTLGVFDSTSDVKVGADQATSASFWDGQIGPIMFWKRMLSSTEVTQVYNNGAGLTYEGILGTGIIPHPLISSSSTANATSYVTASTTIHSNRLAIASFLVARDAGINTTTYTLTSTGATWHDVSIANPYHTVGSPTRHVKQFYTMVGSDQTSALTLTTNNTMDGAAWSVVEFEGVQQGGTDGSSAIVQAPTGSSGGSASTTVSCSLSSFSDATNNVAFGAFGTSQVAGITPGSGLIELYDTTFLTPSNELQVEYRKGEDLTVDATFATADCACQAIEIRFPTSGPSPALLSAIQSLQERSDDFSN